MAFLDYIQFFQALLTSLFLAALAILVPKILAAASTAFEPQSPRFARYIENIYRHNPFQQWMAERGLAASVAKSKFRLLDTRNETFLDLPSIHALICPNRKWMIISLAYIILFVGVNFLGALTIMWNENASIKYDHGPVKYPAWPAKTGLTEMILRGNCRWMRVPGSGDVDKTGFVIYQLCADMFEYGETEKLRQNEARARHNETYYKLVFSFETLTQNGIDEDWKVSAGNEDRLSDVRGTKDYLRDCHEECRGEQRDKGLHYAIIRQALREVGIVERSVKHYYSSKEFKVEDVLQDRRTRLKKEAWITMLGVTIVAMLWTLVGLIKTEGETEFAIVSRMLRESTKYGPTTIQTVLEPGPENKPSFVVDTEFRGDQAARASKYILSKTCSMDGMTKKITFRSTDFVKKLEHEESGSEDILRTSLYSYGTKNGEHARKGMIVVAYRSEEDEEL